MVYTQFNIVSGCPFRQSKTSARPGCQIDYLIQTTTKNLFICEFKFERRELGLDIISDVKQKSDVLKVPRGFGLDYICSRLFYGNLLYSSSNYLVFDLPC